MAEPKKTVPAAEGHAVRAWQIRQDNSVAECTLRRVAREESDINPAQWWRTARGAMVIIDRDHSEYFTDEERAYREALSRAAALRAKAEDRLRAALHREHAAHGALAAMLRERTRAKLADGHTIDTCEGAA